MKMAELRILEKNMRAVEAHKRLERGDDMKGITVQAIFEDSRQGDGPVQVFLPADTPEFSTVMGVLSGVLDKVKVDAEAKVRAMSEKLSKAVGKE